MGGEILVKRGSESEIDRGNVAAKCNKQARQAPQRMRQRIARALCHRASGERDGHCNSCVKKTPRRHAVREMKVRPFGTALQGEVSNSHKLLQLKAAVVNVMVKRRG